LQPYYHSLSPVSLNGLQLDQLLALGWYRMHQHIFTTSHVQLGEVYRAHWLRYRLQELQPHASHKRMRQRASCFRHHIEDFELGDMQLHLHKRYRSSINFEGAPSITDCLFGKEEITASIFTTKTVSVFDGEKLIASGYFDVGKESAASILHFFDPDYSRYSLGKYLILLTIDYLQSNDYQFYYPGYVVAGNAKMDYKLFLGKEQAQYFDPTIVEWRYFEEKILHKPTSGSREVVF
jgi:leucyl-tRNA---protein transferase